MRAFVSSHISLKRYEGFDYQQCACSVARSLGFDASCMDDHAAGPDLETRCRQSVRDSDILVLILGWCYGALHDGAKSLTEIEYDTAQYYDKPVLVFIQDVPPPQIDAAELARAQAFRDKFDLPGDRPLYGKFNDEAGFRRALNGALTSLLHDSSRELLARNSVEVEHRVRKQLPALESGDRRRTSRTVKLSRWEQDLSFDIPPSLREALGGIAEERKLDESEVDSRDNSFPEQHPRVVVCGEFGAGTTFFLEWLELAASRSFSDRSSRIPLRLELGEWQCDEKSFPAFVHAKTKQAFGRRVRGQDLYLLIDGIDNRSHVLDEEAWRQITDWLRDHEAAWAAIAVRQREGLALRLRDDDGLRFTLAELAPLEPSQWVSFIERNTDAGAARNDLIQFVSTDRVKGDADVRRVLQRPLMLQLICGLARKGSPFTFPSNAARLFQEYFLAAYRDECLAACAEPSPEQFFAFLGYRAVRTLIGAAELDGPLPPKDSAGMFMRTLRALRNNADAAESRSVRTWAGPYLGFLAAKYVLDQKVSLKSLLRPPSFHEGYRNAQPWDVAIHHLVQLDADAIIEVARHDPCLAADCLRDVPDAKRSLAADAIARALVEQLREADDGDVTAAVTKSIASIGLLAEPALATSMQRPEHWLRRRLIGALALINGSQSVGLILRALGDSNKWVVAQAERTVLAFDDARRERAVAHVEAFREKALSPSEKQVLQRLWGLDVERRPLLESILGPDAPSDVQPVQDESDSTQEFADYGETGMALASQLSMTSDAALLSRGRAWLIRCTMRENAWVRVWTAVWDRSGGDVELRRLGRAWLRSVAQEKSGPWGHVWGRLIKDAREESGELSTIARQWLRDADPGHVSWPYVWRALTVLEPRDASLRNQGVWWLKRGGRPGNDWAVVWCRLRDMEDAGYDLHDVGKRLLESTPAGDNSWSFVWPVLFDADPGDVSLRELGQTWVRSASPHHRAWGHIWPRLWKLPSGDAGLESSGREWLGTAIPSHPGWNWVWEALWETRPNDEMLRDDAVAWLGAAPPTHEGWARVWEAVWNTNGPSRALDELGHKWLRQEAVRDHPGWPYVFGLLLRPDHPDNRLAALGHEWIGSPVQHKGWAHVWQAMWSHAQRSQDALASAELIRAGVDWVHSTGVGDSGFSQVWQQLWRLQPTDDLKRLAQDHLWQLPSDSTLMFIWLPVSASKIDDEALTTWGTAFLRDMVPRSHPQWGAVWFDLLNRTQGSDALYSLGETWLRDSAGKALGWRSVWRALWDRSPSDPSLITIAISGLQGAVCDAGTWKSVWRTLFPFVGSANRELLSATVQRLRATASSAEQETFWIEAARSLSDMRELPDDLAEMLHKKESSAAADPDTEHVCDDIVRTLSWTRGWIRRWEAAWQRPSTHHRLAAVGVRWLEGAPSKHPAFSYNWHKINLSELERPNLIAVGRRWLGEVDSSAKAWGLVWEGVAREPPIDPAVASAGLAWMDQRHFGRDTWPEVWKALWDLALGDRVALRDVALAWLCQRAPTSYGYAEVWCRLWDADIRESSRLCMLAKPFVGLAVQPKGWIDIVSRVGIGDPPDTDLRERIAKWCEQNRAHPRAALVAGMLGKAGDEPC